MAELILKLKEREIKRINISKVETTMGRDPDCDLFIDNIGVSREHAKLVYRQGRFFIRDNGSSNGTFLNNTKLTGEHEVHDNDEIQLGKYRIIFSGAGGMPEHLLGTQDGGDKKKVRSVFGTVQFSPDEIQNLMAASGEVSQPSFKLGAEPEKPVRKKKKPIDKQTQLNIVLGIIVGLLVILLTLVLLKK